MINLTTERRSRLLTQASNTVSSQSKSSFRHLPPVSNSRCFQGRPRGTVGYLCRNPIGGLWLPRGRSVADADHIGGVNEMVSVPANAFDDSAGQSAQALPSRVLFASVSRRVHALIITKGMANGEKTEGEKVHPNG